MDSGTALISVIPYSRHSSHRHAPPRPVVARFRAAGRTGRRVPRPRRRPRPRRKRPPTSGSPPAAAGHWQCNPAAGARRPADRSAHPSVPPRRQRFSRPPQRDTSTPHRPAERRGRTRRRPRADCSTPSTFPAPRISRSFIATAMPAPSSLFCAMVAKPVVGGFGQRNLRRIQEIGVSTLAAAADPSAQLM